MENKENSNIESKKQENSKGKLQQYFLSIFEFLKIVILALIIVAPIRYFLFQPFIVKGDSMVPNFHSGDYLIVDEISYRFSEPQRGDVIVFNYPKDASQRFIKRVIGLPGEVVVVLEGKIEIMKGEETLNLSEVYLPEDLKTYGNTKLELGENEYFVMGDNREYSYDSRIWGAVTKKDIIGKPFVRLFPLNSISGILRPSYE